MRQAISNMESRERARRALAAAFTLAILAVSACQAGAAETERSGGVAGDEPGPVRRPVKLGISPDRGSGDVRPDRPVTVRVAGGRIDSVVVRPSSGGPKVEGRVADDLTSWRTTRALAPDTSYTVTAEAVGANGKKTSKKSSFTTLRPESVLRTRIAPLDEETVGVGMPIVVYFTHDVSDKAAVERNLEVEASKPVEGAWHWMNDAEAHFRPRTYWPKNTHVRLHSDLKGVHGGSGLWGDRNRTIDFQVGDRHISVVNARTHKMTVKENGRVVRRIPVSTGRDEYPTSRGVHLALEVSPSTVMDSSTVPGIRDSYRITTRWNVRISWSGEYVHSAPWSVGSQGRENVSHGCVNASPGHAKWFYEFTRRGDVIDVRGTPKKLEWGNGWTDWNMSWGDWVKGSALDRWVTTAKGTQGSVRPY